MHGQPLESTHVILAKETHTFDLLTPLPTHILCHLDRIADQRVPARMMHRPFHRRVKLDHVHCETGTFREGTVLVVDGFDLDRVEGDEGRLAGTLVTHVLLVDYC